MLMNEKLLLLKEKEQLRTEMQFLLLREPQAVALSSKKLGAATGKCPFTVVSPRTPKHMQISMFSGRS